MRLELEKVDARTLRAGADKDVIDRETGKVVGFVSYRNGEGGWLEPHVERSPSRRISLFDGKYVDKFESHKECVAFAMGVEAVLNHSVSITHPRFADEPSEAVK